MKAKEILSRLTGISCPIFGVQWHPPELEIAIARRVITFLEDRRSLYNPDAMETPGHCIASVIEIRSFLTGQIGDLHLEKGLAENLRAMRATCRWFLDSVGYVGHSGSGDYESAVPEMRFFVCLGELRARMGVHVAMLAVMFDLEIERQLETILPPESPE